MCSTLAHCKVVFAFKYSKFVESVIMVVMKKCYKNTFYSINSDE